MTYDTQTEQKTRPDTAGTEIPAPPDFPIEWENEEDRAKLWQWSGDHAPLPSSTMSNSLSDASVSEGMERVAEEFGQKRSGGRNRIEVNGYSYYAVEPPAESKDEAKEDNGAEEARDEAMEERMAAVRRRWDDEWLPLLKRDLRHMAETDLQSPSEHDLLQVLDDFLVMSNEHWYIHFLVVYPVHAAANRLIAAYRELMGGDEGEAMRLLQGLDNMSMVVGRALRELAGTASAEPRVAEAFEAGRSAAHILKTLESLPEARGFLDALDAFLREHGYRPASFDSINPSWIEDPSFVILTVKGYMAGPPRDLDAEREELAREAEKCLERVLEKMGNDEDRREEFLRWYEEARGSWILKEDHSYYIDQASSACLRFVVAEMGQRLHCRGHLDDPVDVFYMTLPEAREALVSSAPAPLQDLVAPRKQEREHFMRVLPPRYIGTMPSGGLEDEHDAGPASEDAEGLRGAAGSPGSYTGPARIVRGAHQFDTVRPGDVLVCTSTSPTWTPLFGAVGALVSETGGALSHTAIVAREYGIPAAVMVQRATERIQDGQLVTVIGDSGAVLLH